MARVLVIAHRTELITQAVGHAKRAGLTAGIEMGSQLCPKGTDVVVSTVQTLNSTRKCDWCSGGGGDCGKCKGSGKVYRMTKLNPLDFGAVIIDESHHASATSYRRILKHFMTGNPDLNVLGVTATPKRADGVGLHNVFDSVAYEMDLLTGINEGWLCPIRQRFVECEHLDISGVGTKAGGDLADGELSRAFLELTADEEQTLHEIVYPTLKEANGQQVLFFAPGVEPAKHFTASFNRHGATAELIVGGTDKDERKRIVERYKNKETQVLVNCMVATEGFDAPDTAIVANARPTKSESLYCLDSKTEILTPDGWKGIGDLHQIAQVASMNPLSGRVQWCEVIGKIRRSAFPNERFVSYQSPHLDIRVTDNHDMLIKTRRGRKRIWTPWTRTKAIDAARTVDTFRVPVSGVQDSDGVPLSDDELRFIGWVMTDGTINKYTKQITITQGEHQPWVNDIDAMLSGCRFKFTKSTKERQTSFNATSDAVIWTISHGKPRGTDKHLTGWGKLEPFMSKDFAESLDAVTEEQFDVLLHAIHLGDGDKQPKNVDWKRASYHISTGNKTFAERIQSLAVRRGWSCNMATYPNHGKNPLFKLHLKKNCWKAIGGCNSKDRPVFQVETWSAEDVWCVQSQLGTLVTRRNGKVCIVGNCQIIGRGTRPLPGTVDGPVTAIDRRAAIAASVKPYCTVLDFVGNSGRHKLVSVADCLAGETVEADVSMAVQMARQSDEAVDMQELFEKAKQAREEKEKRAEERRRQRLETRTYAESGEYSAHDVDLFGGGQFDPFTDYQPTRDMASQKQVNLLMKLGVKAETATGYTKKQAGAVITKMRSGTGKDYIVTFGKHAGKKLSEIPSGYVRWMKENLDRPELQQNIAMMEGGKQQVEARMTKRHGVVTEEVPF